MERGRFPLYRLEVMRDLLHGIDWTPPEGATAGRASTALHKASVDAVARFALDEDGTDMAGRALGPPPWWR